MQRSFLGRPGAARKDIGGTGGMAPDLSVPLDGCRPLHQVHAFDDGIPAKAGSDFKHGSLV